MKKWITVMAASLVLNTADAQTNYLITGTYTGGASKGIYVYLFNSRTGKPDSVSMVEASNPSYIAVAPDEQHVYAVHENGKDGSGGRVSAYSFNKHTGMLKLINTQSTEGDYPCYVEVDKTGRWVFAGNYGTGNFTMFAVNDSGGLDAATQKISHYGTGADPKRQEGPHVHSTNMSPDNKFLYVPDLGIDKVMIYAFDAAKGTLDPAPAVSAESRPGSGPRHMAFHPSKNWVYLIEEISGTVVAYSFTGDKFTEMQRLSTLEKTAKGDAGSADIHVSPDGKFLYASNRGEFNNIAIYSIDEEKGTLTVEGFQPVMGKGPRNFTMDPSGKYLLSANQGTDDITIFARNFSTGLLTPTGTKIRVGKPVCLKWISK